MSKWRRTSWQQIIATQASFLDYDCKRLCADDYQNRVAGSQPSTSASARHASDAAMRHLQDARHAAGIPSREPRMARLANVWSGALVYFAFANLHAAKVVLVDLYAEEDIQAAAPAVLARLQACLPADDQRRQRAEAMFGSPPGAESSHPARRPPPPRSLLPRRTWCARHRSWLMHPAGATLRSWR